jgi:hypothetical protein
VAHGIVEQHGILAHDAGEPAQRRKGDLSRVDPVQSDDAAGWLIEAGNEVDEVALARPAGPDERDDVALPRHEAHVAYDGFVVVGERDLVELDRVAQPRHDARAVIELLLRRQVEHLEQSLRRGEGLLRRGRGL